MKDLKADFGAVGDGVTDDTAAIQSGLDWVSVAHDALYVPPGSYRVTAQLSLVQKSNFRVFGATRQAGTYNTSWRWDGVPGGTMLLLDGVRDSEWSGIALDGVNSTVNPAVLLDIDKVAPGTGISRKNCFRGMLLRGGSLASVRISNTATTNNEANLFEDVTVASMVGSIWQNGVPGGPIGYWVKHINAKNQQIVRGEISGKECAVYVEHGSIHLFGTEIAGCNVWVRKAAGGEPCIIERCDGDSSKTFLELLTSQTGPVTARGNRFIQGMDGPLFILGDCIGPVYLQGNEFASGGHRPGATTQITGNGPSMVATGNTFPNDSLLPVPGQTGPRLRALTAQNNAYYAPGNQPKLMNDYLIPYRADGASLTSLQIGGSSGFRGEAQSISGATVILNSNQAIVPVFSATAVVMRSLPTFRPGMFEGQQLKVVNVGNVNVGLIDQGTLPGTLLALSTPTVTLPTRASMDLVWTDWQGGRWLQASPVVTPL
jgi:hypothetical protein